MINWIMLVVGVLGLALSIFCCKWHDALNKHDGRVDYDEYLITGLGAYLLLPASLFTIGGSIYCLLAK